MKTENPQNCTQIANLHICDFHTTHLSESAAINTLLLLLLLLLLATIVKTYMSATLHMVIYTQTHLSESSSSSSSHNYIWLQAHIPQSNHHSAALVFEFLDSNQAIQQLNVLHHLPEQPATNPQNAQDGARFVVAKSSHLLISLDIQFFLLCPSAKQSEL
jgi:hypothetical protein